MSAKKTRIPLGEGLGDRALSRPHAEVHGTRRTELRPLDVEDITLFNLQKAVQAAIDLATHVVAAEGYGVPDSQAAVFTLLQKRGIRAV